tara:strand:+ start:136 stop:615 length:480 start_codon:yes stop_codon:yes gene_type:complete
MSHIKLISKSNQEVKALFDAMKLSETLKALVSYDEDDLDDFDITTLQNPVPLPEVDTHILNLVIQYCQYHHETDDKDDDKKKWDEQFIKIDDAQLFDLILAANYLEITPLLDLACQCVANYIKACKTPSEIRRRFNIKNDFTPEEEVEVQKENSWCNEK